MAKSRKHDPNSQGYTNALLEEIDAKFYAILRNLGYLTEGNDTKRLSEKTKITSKE